MLYQQIEKCRACGSEDIPEVLSLGDFYLSDFLDRREDFTDKAPLTLVRCEECTLVQLRHTVTRDRLYRQYWYRSGTQESMVRALQDVADDAMRRVGPPAPGEVVLDIGANDGTLLACFPETMLRLAYEPAENFWPDLQQRGILIAGRYFPMVAGGRPVGLRPKAKIITSIACFYDVDDPNAFVAGIKKCLADDGVWINQVSYLPNTLRTLNFGDFCHEHLTYWTVLAFDELLAQHEMFVEDYSVNDVNGGSVRFVVRHGTGSPVLPVDASHPEQWDELRERIEEQRDDLLYILGEAQQQGKIVIGYGASTKGNTYLQYWGVGPDLMPLTADRSPQKWGKYTPTGQQIISEQEMRDLEPDYLLVLPWHFLESFKQRERMFLKRGGKFIVPFPRLQLIGGEDQRDLVGTSAAD